jgi:sugar/nucleoside kinase (ribokinase family)
MRSPVVVCVGPQIIDVLIRPVTAIPTGQGGLLLDDARITAAGTAAGTAVDLVKLGAQAFSMGAIGDDTAGRLLRMLFDEHGVDGSRLVAKAGERTSTTVLPIRPNGERPSMHLAGATASLTADDIDWELIADADVLHVGGPDALGEFGIHVVPQLLGFAREHGTTTTVDLLRSHVISGFVDLLADAWPYVDYFLPNDDQLRKLTGIDDLHSAGQAMCQRGVGTVAVTAGADGSFLIGNGEIEHIPAIPTQVVDTTGCGDAYTAGLIVGLQRGWSPGLAGRLGTASASLVAQGLGSDAGIVDLDSTLRYWAAHADQLGAVPR